MDTYNINGVAVEYDTFDTVNMELFINELERVQKETEALPKDVTAYMEGMCELVRDSSIPSSGKVPLKSVSAPEAT